MFSSRMLAAMDIQVRVGPGRQVALPPGVEVALFQGEEPVEAHVELACACGHRTGSAGPVTFESHDPDRVDTHAFTYVSRHAVTCSHCRQPLSSDVRMTVTRHRDTGGRTLSLECAA